MEQPAPTPGMEQKQQDVSSPEKKKQRKINRSNGNSESQIPSFRWDTSRFKLLVRDIETGTPVVELGTVIAFIRAKILYR